MPACGSKFVSRSSKKATVTNFYSTKGRIIELGDHYFKAGVCVKLRAIWDH